jgi:transposase
MANKLKSMLQIKRILQLLIKDKTPGFISKELCISVNTVKKYRRKFKQSGLSYCELFSSSQEKLESLVYPSKDKTQKSLRQVVLSELIPDYVKRLQNTHITRELLWKEYIFKHSEGYSYSQFCEHIYRYMLQAKAVMHLEHKAGDTLQIDFAGSKLSYIDKSNGKKILCPVLVCVLPFSSFCYVEALANMSQLELIGSLNRCLTYFGGVAHNICSDNLKQVVNKPDKYEPKFSDLMDQFALHYNLSLTATRVLKPRDKASVERHVGIAYSRIYAVLEQQQYYSLSELNAALKELLNEFNDAPMQRKNHTRRECFVKYELPFLLPLPDEPFEIKYQTGAKVQTNYHVILGHDWHNYSVPYQLIGKQVKLIYDSEHVEIYHRHKRIAFHKRDYTKNGFTTCDEHRPDNHKIAIVTTLRWI